MKKTYVFMLVLVLLLSGLNADAADCAQLLLLDTNSVGAVPAESDHEETEALFESDIASNEQLVATDSPETLPIETPAGTAAPEASSALTAEIMPECSIAPETPPFMPVETPEPAVTPTAPVESIGPGPTPIPPIETVEPDATPVPIPPEEIEGWMLDEAGKRMFPGKLEDLLAAEGELQILVSTENVIEITEFPIARLLEIVLTPDPELFPGSDWRIVCSSSERLRDEYSYAEIEGAQDGEVAPLFIWVREELPAPTADPTELQLVVHTENVTTGQWCNVQPTFTMEGIGAGSELCEYAVIILDERIAMLSGNSYMPEEEGVYTVRLAIMNELGDIVDRSEKYTLWLDWSAPELMIEVSMEEDRTMHIYAGDRVSGVAGLSLDGGESWHEISDVFSYTAPEKQVFAPGMIQLKDNAGNLTYNEAEIVLKKIPSYGGGSGSTVSKDHAAGDGETASYSAYALEIPAGEMTVLRFGGEEIDLRLVTTDDAQEESLPFRAELTNWATAGGQAGKSPDTLVLRAAATLQEDIIWKVNGAVLRKLYNSDIAYLVLVRDGEMLSLPTIGFTGGTRYAELKMMGASTQEFAYEIHMRLLEKEPEFIRPGFNQSGRLLPGIWVEVDGERWQMLDRESTPEMYFYDVYCAPSDLMDYPYGVYPGTTLDGETEE